jgi:hypothetical protein
MCAEYYSVPRKRVLRMVILAGLCLGVGCVVPGHHGRERKAPKSTKKADHSDKIKQVRKQIDRKCQKISRAVRAAAHKVSTVGLRLQAVRFQLVSLHRLLNEADQRDRDFYEQTRIYEHQLSTAWQEWCIVLERRQDDYHRCRLQADQVDFLLQQWRAGCAAECRRKVR